MRIVVLFIFLALSTLAAAQQASLVVAVHDSARKPLAAATLTLLRSPDSVAIATQVSNSTGTVTFSGIANGHYIVQASLLGYTPRYQPVHLQDNLTIQISFGYPDQGATLDGITVMARQKLVEVQADKTIINLDAGLSNTGTTMLEALEQMPGVTVDKDGNISLKGRSQVLVLIDGKQTYLAPAALATLLQNMPAAQVSQVELMDQPPARYDAAGNAGIINIRTKKNRQQGFNGTINAAFAQGFYPKTNNSLQLNYRNGRFNYFFNYSTSANKQFTRIEALRRYYNSAGQANRLLEQPSFLRSLGTNNTLRTGLDYEASKKTSLGMVLSGTIISRNSEGGNSALWMDANRKMDSLIKTVSHAETRFRNAGLNLNMRHQLNAKSELGADVDLLLYRIGSNQAFENTRIFPGTYNEATRASIPSLLNIASARVDYSVQLKRLKLETGAKTSFVHTDNDAQYHYFDGSSWQEDLGKSNHFRYHENINALYGSAAYKKGRWNLQGGLRWEKTRYNARQLGNAAQKDSTFGRTYNNFFPSVQLGFDIDSNNSISLSSSRRIDRPAFQKLNPFLFIINKYTYQQGNPYFRPQYTWNIELEHQYKGMLITGITYSRTTDYFAQIFPIATNGIVLYTEGNLDLLETWAAAVGLNLSPAKWWSFNAQSVFTHKKMEGFVGRALRADINQLNFTWNNQFRLRKGWSGELTGVYTSRSQHDIQEVVDPAGQLSLGVAKQVLQQKGTVKLAVRDILYTQWMKGNTYFQQADEYFKLTRDTRVATISFSWRFGKAYKTARRSEGAAGEEKARVGTN
ncbi:Outer membrane receptor proteins, mostly Fe transport [Cnuella takakiae]|uniref:Outer membrane receptor proteins, mostly Fe transport n=1 Tax=Cnuella takakiae TaxID=1302690 RepID=A0A1M5EQK5_9BACT|nr:outer membrane beta-barrel protein [Cnuella takakiae]OLY91261.1 hypothetical protein BUE76_04605 [Cnuella takakiae]SHF81421.1 Outer membrane receptor proteins, mostly Fe transport [Cnuella takakiae]